MNCQQGSHVDMQKDEFWDNGIKKPGGIFKKMVLLKGGVGERGTDASWGAED